MDQVFAAGETFTSFSKVINPLIGQIADPSLLQLASSYKQKRGVLSLQITMLLLTMQNYGPEADGLESLMNDITESVNTILPEMLSVNHRIEDLLCGD
jgi:hypothetical protein